MKKAEMIELLLENQHLYDETTLRRMSKDELKELMDELDDDSVLFPNGRDYDAEDEDGP